MALAVAFAMRPRQFRLSRPEALANQEVPDGVGADGVEVKLPMPFASN